MNTNRLKIYALLAGVSTWPEGPEDVGLSVCEGLDWIRAFAVHLFYCSAATSPVEHGLSAYEESFDTVLPALRHHSVLGAAEVAEKTRAAAPLPPYMQQQRRPDQPLYDTCFHLLKHYASRSHNARNTLLPLSTTPHELDYRLSWHLYTIIKALGIHSLSADREDQLHCSYASQLEMVGLWEWSIFVLLHLQDEAARCAAVKDILSRYCPTAHPEQITLVEGFGIPAAWIHATQALHAQYSSDHKRVTDNQLLAGMWNEAHQTIVEHIAPDFIINRQHSRIIELCSKLEPEERSTGIQGWATSGQVYLEYARVLELFAAQQASPNPSLDLIRGQRDTLVSLCNRVARLPGSTPKHQ